MSFFGRVPGGFRIGRVEIYISKPGPFYQFQWFEKTTCPLGCKLYSVGRLGMTILAKECLEAE